MNDTDLSVRQQQLAVVREVSALIEQTQIGINWVSDELQTSFSERSSRRHGPGEEERGVKRYEPGDNLNNLHVPATAASADPDDIFIRTYFKSRVLRFNVLLNVGPSMNFGTHNTLKMRLGAAAAGAGLKSAILAQDIGSFVTYANRPMTIRIEHNASDILFESLVSFITDGTRAPRIAEGGGLAKAYETVRHMDRSVMLIVDDFAYMSSADWEALRLIGCQHDAIAVFVQDPRERQLPEVPWPGASYSFEDCAGRVQTMWVTPSRLPRLLKPVFGAVLGGKTITGREEYAENFQRHSDEVVANLKQRGILPLIAGTDTARDDIRKLVKLLARENR